MKYKTSKVSKTLEVGIFFKFSLLPVRPTGGWRGLGRGM